MKKILYVFCSQNFSGAEIVMERLIVTNPTVNPVALCPPGDFAIRLNAHGIKVVEEPALSSLERGKNNFSDAALAFILILKFIKITARVMQLVRTEKFDVIHANNVSAAFYTRLAMMLCKALRKKIVWIWSNHDVFYPDGNRSKKIASLCHAWFDQTIAVSQAVKNAYPQFTDKIDVLYNGLDANQFKPVQAVRTAFRTKYAISDADIAIGIVGVVSHVKGQHLLLDAFNRLHNQIPNTVLFIIGKFNPQEPTYESEIRKMADQYGKHCIVTGPLTDMVAVYNGLDIVVNATLMKRSEPLGTTIYEAMACECLVLATATGGSPEIISDGQDGYLCQSDDAASLSERLLYMSSHFTEMTQMRYAARQKVLNKFSIETMVITYNRLLDAFLGKDAHA
jgi:glycosyltransferase involved in cell wall biosynthesis